MVYLRSVVMNFVYFAFESFLPNICFYMYIPFIYINLKILVDVHTQTQQEFDQLHIRAFNGLNSGRFLLKRQWAVWYSLWTIISTDSVQFQASQKNGTPATIQIHSPVVIFVNFQKWPSVFAFCHCFFLFSTKVISIIYIFMVIALN